MFCTKCGHKNIEESAFCVNCGSALQSIESQPQASQGRFMPLKGHGQYMPPPQGMYPNYPLQVPKKSRKGLVVGLCIGGIVIIAAAVVLVILLTGKTPIVGQWYSDERTEVVEFNDDGTMIVYTVSGDNQGEYKFDNSKGEGIISIAGAEYDFETYKDELLIQGVGAYIKAKDGFDVNNFIDDAISAFNGFAGDDFIDDDLSDGGAAPADRPSLAPDQIGILGTWYETTGFGGTMDFYSDGTFSMKAMGITISGSYTFNPAMERGELNIEFAGETTTSTIYLKNGILDIDGMQYTKEYVEQIDPKEMLEGFDLSSLPY
ncbi:MAG: zinc-ribbon domain-containing protein [Christensenellales bacterium]|jgi:hypothetical protein